MVGRGQPRVSLFPFMSILACTIGALTLLLVAMSLSAVGATDAAARAYTLTTEAIAGDELAIEQEEERLARAEELWSEVDHVLETRGLRSGLSLSSIELEIERTHRRAAVALELAKIEDEVAHVASERDVIETTIEVLENRRETLPIMIDPTGLSRHFVPYFIECDAQGATAYRARDDFRYFVAKADLSTSGDFGRYLRRVRAEPGALLVLLVRRDGLSTCDRTEQVARGAEIRVARLPLPGTGKIDWSLLRRAEGEKE